MPEGLGCDAGRGAVAELKLSHLRLRHRDPLLMGQRRIHEQEGDGQGEEEGRGHEEEQGCVPRPVHDGGGEDHQPHEQQETPQCLVQVVFSLDPAERSAEHLGVQPVLRLRPHGHLVVDDRDLVDVELRVNNHPGGAVLQEHLFRSGAGQEILLLRPVLVHFGARVEHANSFRLSGVPVWSNARVSQAASMRVCSCSIRAMRRRTFALCRASCRASIAPGPWMAR